MKKVMGPLAAALLVAVAAPAQVQNGKIAVINLQSAIVSTKDGQKAAAELETKYGPRRKAVSDKQSEINALRDQLQKGQNTLSDAAKNDLYKNIDAKTKLLNRDMEDASAELQQDQDRLLQDLSQKIQVVIDKYARDNGYALVIDVSSQQTPVVYASNTIDITKEVVDLYDKSSAAMAPAAPAASVPAKPAPGTTK
ncbi:MAG TPA: OmpH family outer membrane protein [Bryobacteraceae bacterium]|nr:OmpH family outer membrane protein [Bryobacteraceae bacterium]